MSSDLYEISISLGTFEKNKKLLSSLYFATLFRNNSWKIESVVNLIYLKAHQRLAEHHFVHPKLGDYGWNYICCSLRGNLQTRPLRYSLALIDHLLRTHFCHFYLLFCTTICNSVLNESLTHHISILFIKSYFYFLIRSIQTFSHLM